MALNRRENYPVNKDTHIFLWCCSFGVAQLPGRNVGCEGHLLASSCDVISTSLTQIDNCF